MNPDYESARETATAFSTASKTGWTFTTVYTDREQDHPVSEHPQFGIVSNADGSYTLFTRGVDRLTNLQTTLGHVINNITFEATDNLWESLRFKAAAFVVANGGSAQPGEPVIARPDWSKLEGVLTGQTNANDFEGCAP